MSSHAFGPVVSAVIAFLTTPVWAIHSVRIIEGVDPAWRIALHRVFLDRLAWGDEVTNTLGPLGFAAFPMLGSSQTGWISIMFFGFAHFAAVWGTFAVVRRSLGVVAAGIGTYLMVVFVWNAMFEALLLAEAAAALFGLLCLSVLGIVADGEGDPLSEFSSARQVAVAGAAGIATAVMMLVKLSTGTQSGVVGAATLAVLFLYDRDVRRLALLGGTWCGSVVVTYLVGWVLLGQPLSNLFGYLTSSVEMMSGYASGMGVVREEYAWSPRIGLFLALALIGIGLLRWRRVGWPHAALFLVPLVGLFYFVYKLGFVRTDAPHVLPYFMTIATLGLAMLGGKWPMRIVAIAFIVLATMAGWRAAPDEFELGATLNPSENIDQSREHLRLVTDGEYRRQAVDRFAAATRERTNLSPEAVELLTGHRVHVDPIDTNVLWVYSEFEWGAPPTFQPYLANTSSFDDLGADWLRDDERAPDYILRLARSIDRRSPAHESPEYMIEMYCRYEQVGTTPYRKGSRQKPLAILERVENRCGEITEIANRTVQRNGPSPIRNLEPCAGHYVFAVEGLHTLGQQIRATLYKDASYQIAYRNQRWFRLVPGNAEQWHLFPGGLPDWLTTEPAPRKLQFRVASSTWLTPGEVDIRIGCLPVAATGETG